MLRIDLLALYQNSGIQLFSCNFIFINLQNNDVQTKLALF